MSKRSLLCKFSAILLSLTLVFCCVPMTAFAAYENTHVNTGNQAYDIMAIAETQVGYLEGSLAGTTAGSNNYTKYGVWYADYFSSPGFKYGAWCAMFVSWCANQAGVSSDVFTYHASCTAGVNWWKNRNLFQYSAYHGGNYTPKEGDVIYFGGGKNDLSHVGLVRYASGGRVYTIEGNTSGQNGEVNEGGGCFAKSYSLSYSRIVGYATPNYVTSGSAAQKLGTYVVTASSLNVRTGTDTSYDIVAELDNGAIVNVTELKNGWGKVKLADGTEGWCSIVEYGNYIGVDALSATGKPAWGIGSTALSNDGKLTIINPSATDTLGYDLVLPFAIGTNTTPFLTAKVTPVSGGGFYYGITQADTGYFLMRDTSKSAALTLASEAPFITQTDSVEIDLRDLWEPKEGYQIDTVRFYIAPSSTITIDYCYFADDTNVVRDTTYNLTRGDGSAPDASEQNNVNLLDPEKLSIVDMTKEGSYTYDNGKLSVTSADETLYEVSFDVNLEFTPEQLRYLLYSVDANVRYDIELVVTTTEGDRVVSLASDFWPELCKERDGMFLPAADQSAALNLYSVYTYNDVLPANGKSTIKKVTVQVGGFGTVHLDAIQINDTGALKVFEDGVYRFEESGEPAQPGVTGDVDNDGVVTSSDARAVVLYNVLEKGLSVQQLLRADIDGDGVVSTNDARIMMITSMTAE